MEVLYQLYAARRAQPDDLVQAYTWYLIATERATQTKAALREMLTPQQLQDAEHRSSVYLTRMNQDPAQGMDRDTNSLPSRTPAKRN